MSLGLTASQVGLIGIGTNLLGSAMGASAAGDAADAQVQSGREANATQRYMYDTTRADQAPYRDVGYSALDAMRARMGLRVANPSMMPSTSGVANPSMMPGTGTPWTSNAQFSPQQLMQEDPSYQFRLSEGEKALNRSAAAGSGQLSGATLKALSRYNQDYASNEFNNSFNRLSALAGIGQTATNQVGAAGNAFANNSANLQTQMGNARAAGYVGQANAWNRGLGGAFGALQDQSMINALQRRPHWANAYGAGYGDTSRYDAYAPTAVANGGWGIE
jgi:hypothetical protein